jgi:hypothetical protein
MTTTKELLAEYSAAAAEFDASADVGDDRFNAAWCALIAARPTDPADLAALLRWCVAEVLEPGVSEGDLALLRHIAEQLEAMGRAGR